MAEHGFPADRSIGECRFREYALVFKNDGELQSMDAAKQLVQDAARGDFTDVILICHGWNTTWDEARTLYESFQDHFYKVSGENGPQRRLLWVGLHWHSIPDIFESDAPKILGAGGDVGRVTRPLSDSDLSAVDWELPAASVTVDDLRSGLKQAMDAAEDEDEEDEEGLRLVDDSISKSDVEYGLAGGVARLAITAPTVWKMKNRAGAIGRGGLANLVRELATAAPRTPLRGIGHSFGCHLHLACLTKLAADGAVGAYRSLLLLQPAVSSRSFAAKALADGTPGGFRPALGLVEQPIISTFSDNDDVLRVNYPNAMAYREYLAEIQPKSFARPGTAAGIIPLHAALGGHGPAKSEDVADRQPLALQPDAIDWNSKQLIAVDGTPSIADHGDVDNAATAWLLCQQIQHS